MYLIALLPSRRARMIPLAYLCAEDVAGVRIALKNCRNFRDHFGNGIKL